MLCRVVPARHTLTFRAGLSFLDASGQMAVTRASTSYAAGATDCSCDRTASAAQDGVAAAGPTAAAPRVACLAPAVEAAAIVNGTMSIGCGCSSDMKGGQSQQLSFELLTAGQSPGRHVLILCAHACVLHIRTITIPACLAYAVHVGVMAYSTHDTMQTPNSSYIPDVTITHTHKYMTHCTKLQARRTQLVVEVHLWFS